MRITGGTLRSRAVAAPKGTATRPTSDRVREALFSMLASGGYLAPDGTLAPTVLDLYAGSGALAFEALSRGAEHAVLVESARPAAQVIASNVRDLGLTDKVRLVTAKVERALKDLTGPFGVVLVDPPYALVGQPAFADVLAGAGRLLAQGGVLVLEHASGDPSPAVAGLEVDRSRVYGDTAVTLYVAASRSGQE